MESSQLSQPEIADLARLQITNDKQLQKVLRQSPAKLRKSMYEFYKPLLNFKPKPFFLLKF